MKISIITINYNNAEGLERTLISVISQTYIDIEYIIIDGGSTDGSIDILKRYSDKISFWVSEPDNGIYNAMNKGINKATGAYYNFLNSGDCFLNNQTVKAVVEQIQKYKTTEVFYSNVVDSASDKLIEYPQTISFKHFYKYTINHQATFFKSNLFIKIGLFNENYKIVSDWEFFLKAFFLNRVTYKFIDFPIIKFDFSSGISTRSQNYAIIQSERSKVLNQLFPYFIKDYDQLYSLTNSKTWKLVAIITKFKLQIFRLLS